MPDKPFLYNWLQHSYINCLFAKRGIFFSSVNFIVSSSGLSLLTKQMPPKYPVFLSNPLCFPISLYCSTTTTRLQFIITKKTHKVQPKHSLCRSFKSLVLMSQGVFSISGTTVARRNNQVCRLSVSSGCRTNQQFHLRKS